MERRTEKVLNAYLTIDLQKERGNFSEGLIRIKTLQSLS